MVEKVYWDSDCFLGYLQAEQGKTRLCEQVLEAAEDGEVSITTSAVTLTEVLAVKKGQIPQGRRDDVISFFQNKFIIVKNLDRKISEIARDIVWENGISPKEACHVATAMFFNLDTFHTFDRNLIAKSGQIGTPRIIFEKPSVSAPKFDFSGGL